jgi:hypothetical protein
MTILYKLTDSKMQTRGGFQWNLNKPRTAPGGGSLCSSAWLHAYTDPLLAVLLNPIHADIEIPGLFRCEGEVGADDHGIKVGCTKLNLLEELEIPKITTEQHTKFGILCAREVVGTKYPRWSEWATRWLSGVDRTRGSARAAEWTTKVAESMGWAARAAWAGYEACAAAHAAEYAAEEAAESGKPLDLIALAHEACE